MIGHTKEQEALLAFVEAVEAVGVVRRPSGILAPTSDPEWADLGVAYGLACEALGRPTVEPQERVDDDGMPVDDLTSAHDLDEDTQDADDEEFDDEDWDHDWDHCHG